MIYTLTFNPAIDYVLQVDKLLQGQVLRAVSDKIYYGGKGINISLMLNNLRGESVAMGFTAGFTGRELERGLRNIGILTDFIRLHDGMTRINVKIKEDKETDINAMGPIIDDGAIKKLFRKLNRLDKDDFLCLAGSVPQTMSSDIYETILERFSDKGINFVVDATGELLLKTLKYSPFLIKPNLFELGEIFEKKIENETDVIFHARKLQEMGARNVLVSMAGRGAIFLSEDGECLIVTAPIGKVKNSVGAGDSMVAGFLVGYLEKQDYSFALRMGAASGSATAFSDNLATLDDVVELLNKLTVIKK